MKKIIYLFLVCLLSIPFALADFDESFSVRDTGTTTINEYGFVIHPINLNLWSTETQGKGTLSYKICYMNNCVRIVGKLEQISRDGDTSYWNVKYVQFNRERSYAPFGDKIIIYYNGGDYLYFEGEPIQVKRVR